MRKIKNIIVHHSDTNTGNATTFKRYHVKVLGWSDLAYHGVILKNGITELGRDLSKQGAHAKSANRGSIGICLVGKLENIPPTPEQYISLVRLLEEYCFAFKLDPKGTFKHKGKTKFIISGHCDFNSTDCPGASFYKLLPQIRIDVDKKLKEHKESVGQ